MSLFINTNVQSLDAQRNLFNVGNKIAQDMQRLSSGLRINSAADDAAGYTIANKMQAQVNGLTQAVQNAQDGISLIQTETGTLNEVSDMLQRMRTLSVEAANNTNVSGDRSYISGEINQLALEITRQANSVKFNGKHLLNGSMVSLTLQVGAYSGTDNQITVTGLKTMTASALGVNALAVSTTAAADSAITVIDSALKRVNTQQATLGAVQNRLEYTIKDLQLDSENITEAMSRIRDANMAQEMSNFTRDNIISQAATQMLTQANSQPQSILSLLRG